MALVTSPKGVKAIVSHEGEVLEAYRDAAGIWTIGVGYTGRDFAYQGNTITKQKSRELLKKELKVAEDCIHRHVVVPLSQEQFDALVSFIYNVGCGAFARSTLLKKLNSSDYLGAADEFTRWNKAGGRVLAGLVRRRAEERSMFLNGTSIQTTEDDLEANIEPDLPKPHRSVSEPGVQATGTVVAAGTLESVTSSLEPFAAYSQTLRIIWVVLGLTAIFYVVWRSKKKEG